MTRATPLLLLLPFFAAFLLLWAVPLAEGLRLSLSSDTLYGQEHFVGLLHYQQLLDDERYTTAWINTFSYALLSIGLVVPIALGLAQLLRRCHWRTQGLLRFVLLIPGLTPPAILGLLFMLVFNGPQGMLNTTLSVPFGFPAVDWLRDPNFILAALLLQAIWRWAGLIALFLSAGLDAIPPAHYEIARCEGANAWQSLTRITLPGLRGILVFVCAFLMLDAFAMFAGAYLLLGRSGGTEDAGLLLVTYAYQTAFTYGRFGSAAAISFSVVPVLISLLAAMLLLFRSPLAQRVSNSDPSARA